MLKEAQARLARERGCSIVVASVAEYNKPSMRMLEKAGFSLNLTGAGYSAFRRLS